MSNATNRRGQENEDIRDPHKVECRVRLPGPLPIIAFVTALALTSCCASSLPPACDPRKPRLIHPSRACGAGFDVPCRGQSTPCDEDAGRHGAGR